MLLVVYTSLLFALIAHALNVTSPVANEVIDISKPFDIKWIGSRRVDRDLA